MTHHGMVHHKRHRRGRRKWMKRAGVAVGLIALLAGVALWTVTRPWFLGWQLAPLLAERLGGDVKIDRVEYEGNGKFRAMDMTLSVPQVAGEGGTIARVKEAEVTVDPTALQRGRVRVTNIVLNGLTLRFSEDATKPGLYNFMQLAPEVIREGDQRMSPRVRIQDAVVEVGRHEQGRFQKDGERRMKGSLEPTAAKDGWYEFELTEIDEQGKELEKDGIHLQGRWNKKTNEEECTINEVGLDDRIYRMLPIKVRREWDRMELTGRVKQIHLHWKPSEGPGVEFAVEDVGITLPFETRLLWARYTDGEVEETQGQPRMQAREGELRFRNDQLELKGLKGLLRSTDSTEDITPVPYEVNLTIGPIGNMDWSDKDALFAQMKETLPFHAKFDVTDFRMQAKEEGGTAKVELPFQVANVFSRLMLRDWVMSCSVEVWREAGETGMDAIKRRGTAVVRDARLSYRKFPYQIEGAEAYLEFDQNRVTVHHVTGRGSQGAEVTVSGEIAPPDAQGAVNMRVTARNVPLDERFRASLKDKNLEAYDSMFDAKALESITKSGAFTRDGSGEIVKPGDPWGMIDVDLTVIRESGENKPTTMTGKVTIDHAMVLYNKFPYPLVVKSGWLDWEKNQISLNGAEGKGWKVESIGGGKGWFNGSLDWRIEPEGRKLQPHFTFEVQGDQMNPAILAAIPISKEEQIEAEKSLEATSQPSAMSQLAATSQPEMRLSKAARILAGLNMQGVFDCSGKIDMGPDGHAFYDVGLTVTGGKISPDASLAKEIGLRGEVWPEGFAVEDVSADVRIGRDAIELRKIEGQGIGAEVVEATGVIHHDAEGTKTDLTIGLRHHELSDRVVKLLPDGEEQRAHTLWERYQPKGLITANIHFATLQGGGHETTVDVAPELLELSVDGQEVLVQGESGMVNIKGGAAHMEDLRVRLSADGQAEGVIGLNGMISGANEKMQLDMKGTWTGGEFESPLISEGLAAMGTPEDMERVNSMQLSGGFDAAFEYATAQEGRGAIARFSARPKTISADVNGTRVTMEVEKGEVDVSKGGLVIKNLSGTHAGGHIEVDGSVKTSGTISGDLTINYDGRILSDSVQCFLPKQVKDLFSTIKFEERMSTGLRNGRLVFSQKSGTAGEDDWAMMFDGTLQTQEASFVAGVPFTNVNGDLDVHVERDVGDAPSGTIAAHAKSLRVLGHTLTDVEAGLNLADDGKLLEINDIRARATGGRVTANAEVGIGARKDYRASVEVVAVSLEEFFESPKDLTPSAAGTPEETTADRPTGDVYASFSIAGVRDDPASRRGKGMVRVPNGELATVPLGFRLLQMLQMTLPMGSKLDSAAIDFFIDGDLVKFERIVMEKTSGNSASVTFTGEGVMDYSTLELNLRFKSRSGLILVKEILGEVTDQLWEIEVTGPLSAPQARLVPLPGMRGDRNTSRDGRMSAIGGVNGTPN